MDCAEIGEYIMILTYSHIQITAIPQLLDEEFKINMAEADRQIALAMSAPDLLAERDRLLQANAELVAALQAVTILASSSMAGAKANLSKAGSIARAVIAKVEVE